MERTTIIWLIVAACLVMLGASLFTLVMALNHWDFNKLGTTTYETNTHHISEDFRDIHIISDTADILLVPAMDGSCTVDCFEAVNEKHSVEVIDGILTIRVQNNKKWYEYIGINFGSPKLTLCLPQRQYGALTVEEHTGDVEIPKELTFEAMDITVSTGKINSMASVFGPVKLRSSTGNIGLEGISAESLELSVSTGKITVSHVTCPGDIQLRSSTGKTDLKSVSCKSLSTKGTTGDITLSSVIAAEIISIERDTGDVTFEGSDAAEIFVKTSTGRVKGTLLSDKIFITQTGTGSVNVPHTTTGGQCRITTGTGNINIRIP